MADRRMGGNVQSPAKQFEVVYYVLMAALLLLVPLGGVVFLDSPFEQYLEFPPKTKYIIHPPFSRPVFIVLFLVVGAACLPFVYRLFTCRAERAEKKNKGYPFPWWGWLGIVTVLLFWILAWNRFSFFTSLQRYTFTPLWIGYILVLNGLSCLRKGTCLLRDQPGTFFLLFPASALFWWYFEYLNRFVQNWYYLTGGNISTEEYVYHASLCFSTVLPAVLSTYEFLRTMPRLSDAFADWHSPAITDRKEIGWLLLAAALLSLAGLAVFPNYLFPMVWVSPLLVITGMQLTAGKPTVFSGIGKGDWRQVVLPALAALVCGFFWEMWNWKSLAHWEYSIPFVHRFRIFMMPMLGYAGYLPFGLECIAAASLISGQFIRKESKPVSVFAPDRHTSQASGAEK